MLGGRYGCDNIGIRRDLKTLPSLVQRSSMRVPVKKMHSSLEKQDRVIEGRCHVGTPWIGLWSGSNCASLQLHALQILACREVIQLFKAGCICTTWSCSDTHYLRLPIFPQCKDVTRVAITKHNSHKKQDCIHRNAGFPRLSLDAILVEKLLCLCIATRATALSTWRNISDVCRMSTQG